MSSNRWRATIGAALASTCLAALAIAATEGSEDAAARGAVTYRVYCASCHGTTARGDGKLATALVRRPSNLTVLARKNGGTFPADRVRESIDGRKEVAEHGDRDMPVWGLSFQPDKGGDKEKDAAVRAKLDDLVAYLASIQAPVEKKTG